MNDKEIIDKIKKESDKLNIPSRLSPEAIEKNLSSTKGLRKSTYLKFASIAAVLALVIISSFIIKTNNNSDIVHSSENYKEIFSLLKSIQNNNTTKASRMDSNSTYKEDSTSNEDFSTTNTQIAGIDEGDIIKNDDKYIYATNENKINIVETNNGDMNLISTIETDNDYIDEIYISGHFLISIGHKDVSSENSSTSSKLSSRKRLYNNNSIISTSIYDISNKNNINLVNTVTSTGSYSSSRLVDDYLYMFSNFYANDLESKNATEDYIPYLNNKAIPSDCILVPSSPKDSSYVVITSLKISDPKDFTDKKAVIASSNDFYVSKKNIYVYSAVWDRKNDISTETEIIKFSYNNGNISAKASNTIKGTLNNSFSMDEYNDNLRLVSTIESFDTSTFVASSKNSLYILDKNLDMLSSIEDLGPDEYIYSARFLGDTGYFVTFKQTDPLFSIDLSNPKEPKILGTLKIPGFSSYLHSYDDNLLLGIGMDVDENTNEQKGIKLSMFDVSNPSNVKEINKLVLDNYIYSDALYNHKAVFIDTKKNIFGFEAYDNSNCKYLTYSYDKEKGFINTLNTNLTLDTTNTRGLYIGNTLYVVSLGEKIQSFDLNTFDKISELNLLSQ